MSGSRCLQLLPGRAFGGISVALLGIALVLSGVEMLLLERASAQEAPPRKTILQIRIRGLQRESEAKILESLRIRVGETYDHQKVSLETGTLYGTKKFRRVLDPEVIESENGVTITFTVEERPIIQAVEFQGRRALKEGKLRGDIESKSGGLFSEASLQRDRELVLEKYLEAGYLFATVRTEIRESPQAVRVIFVIEEGTRVRIREVNFTGNKAITSGTLLSIMNTREKDMLFGLLRPGYYDPEALEDDLINIRNYYGRFGFFDAQIEMQDLSLDAAKEKMTITIRVLEGPQYTFQGYRLSKNQVFTDDTLLGLTRAIPGQPFSADEVQRDQQEIKNYYGDRAYIFAKVAAKPEVSMEGHNVWMRLDVEEGNEIYIEQIKIQGNEKTQDRVIRRELEFYPGERVDRSKLAKSRSNLSRLQIFKTIDYTYENGSSPSDKTVVVKVEEEQTGRLIVGFGVTSGFGVIGNFSILKRNFDITDLPESFSLAEIQESFTGAGQTLNIQAQPGTQRSLYRFSLTEPYIFDTRNALTLSAAKLTILRPDYDEDRATFAPRLSHAFDFDRDFVFSLGSRLEEVQISRIRSDAPADAFLAEGFTTIIAASVGVQHDKRLFEYLEGYFDGTLNAIDYEYGGGFLGGELDFHKAEISNEYYWTLYTHGAGSTSMHHVISLTNRAGIIEPHDSNDSIPIFERFFLGGPNTVRGFQFRGLGPHDGHDPIGGTGMLYGNLEYSFPLFLKILRGVVFLDYGNLSRTPEEFSLGDMRYALGGGVRVNFPFLGSPLPIGLYLGFPLKQEDEDRTRLFLFTIGTPF
ncbi:MAG TPA: outer membrane protein assembly factor BamA [Planctomycetota bacterium]|nr:outer membrane protein assembly factor BamA [Planctomycetota bacterium]